MNACECCGSTQSLPLFEENDFKLVQCDVCNLAYVENAPDKLVWEAGPEPYRDFDDLAQIPLMQCALDMVIPFVNSGKWLDIGCGQGILVGLAEQRGFEAFGLEVDPLRISIARSRHPGRIYDRPVEELGLPERSFAVVSAMDVFSHVRSPKRFFRTVHSLLRPDGVFLLRTGEVSVGVKKKDSHFWNLGDHLQFLGAGTIEHYCMEAGFKIVDVARVRMPELWVNRDHLAMGGRSRVRNVLKRALLSLPGAYVTFRAGYLYLHRDNACYSCDFVLRPK